MSDYTKKNVSELKDSAPEFGFAEIAEARFPAKELEAEQAGFAHHRLKSGKRQAFGHQHEDAEEVVFVVAGAGRVKLDDDIVELEQGDFLRVAPPVKRRFEAGPMGSSTWCSAHSTRRTATSTRPSGRPTTADQAGAGAIDRDAPRSDKATGMRHAAAMAANPNAAE